MFKVIIRFLSLFIVLNLSSLSLISAQENNLNTDELFNQARNIPKEKDNYPKIINLLNQALEKSPNYADLRLFLGRVYTWDDNLDSARFQFNQVLALQPENEEAHSAIFDLEYWNNNYHRALDHANMGLLYLPNSSSLVLRKGKVLVALERKKDAIDYLKDYLSKNPEDKEVKSYYQTLVLENTKNQISLGYEYVYFDKRFNDPWHYASIGYTRDTPIGSVSANLLYSNRFKTDGWAGEIEAYPSLFKGVYAYLGFGFSDSPTFYKYRGGASLYYVLPKSFDAETGVRYLNFNPTETYIYVFAVGKYLGNFYLNLKTYLSPDVNTFSHSFTFSTKYYFSDRYNALGFQVGTGISPDDRTRSINGFDNLRSYKVGLSYAKDLGTFINMSLSSIWYYEEYRTNIWGNQLGLGVSLMKKF